MANNPIELAVQEAFAIDVDRDLDFILSIGTGKVPISVPLSTRSQFSYANFSVNLRIDSERIHQNTLRWIGAAARSVRKEGRDRTKVIRWNPVVQDYGLDET